MSLNVQLEGAQEITARRKGQAPQGLLLCSGSNSLSWVYLYLGYTSLLFKVHLFNPGYTYSSKIYLYLYLHIKALPLYLESTSLYRINLSVKSLPLNPKSTSLSRVKFSIQDLPLSEVYISN